MKRGWCVVLHERGRYHIDYLWNPVHGHLTAVTPKDVNPGSVSLDEWRSYHFIETEEQAHVEAFRAYVAFPELSGGIHNIEIRPFIYQKEAACPTK